MKIKIGLNHLHQNKETKIEVVDNPYLPPDVLFVVTGDEDMIFVKENENGMMKPYYVDVSRRTLFNQWKEFTDETKP